MIANDNVSAHRDSEIQLDIAPMTFEVMAELRGGRRAGGGAVLRADQTGIFLQWEKEATTLNPREPISAIWGDLRELRRGKKRFSINIGTRKTPEFAGDDIILKFFLKGNSRAKMGQLLSIFDMLPAQASSRRCPECSGPVTDDLCQKCGRSFSAYHRLRGIRYLVLGGLLTIAGIALGPWLSRSKLWIVLVALIVFGVVYLIAGLIRLIFGIRAG